MAQTCNNRGKRDEFLSSFGRVEYLWNVEHDCISAQVICLFAMKSSLGDSYLFSYPVSTEEMKNDSRTKE